MRFSKTTISVFLFVCGGFIAIPAAQAQTTWFVDDDGVGGCTSWADACPDLQTGLGMAVTGDQIWVAEGIYAPTGPGGDRTARFQLISGVALYGGFAGGESLLSQRDPQANVTILSGDLNGDDRPNFANNAENSYHVATGSGTDATAVLDGFTITGGKADTPNDHILGAG